MKKTLLIAAAALAAGIISTQAQTVYSQNVVGYYNVTIAPHSYFFMSNQLRNGSDVGQTNDDVNVVLSSGMLSDPNATTNTVLYIWTGSGYGIILQYFNQNDANSYWGNNQAGWYDGGGNVSTAKLPQGVGAFLYNASTSPMISTVTGTVVTGTNVVNVPTGFNTYGIYQPISTNIDSSVVGFPASSDANAVNNDVYYGWTGTGWGTILQYFNQSDANSYWGNNQAGWYDGGGNNQSLNPAMWPTVGQGFIVNHLTAPVTWTNTFTVQ